MMKTISTIFLLFALFAAHPAIAKSSKKKSSMNKRWHRLYQLIDKEIKSIHHIKKKGPRLQYRLFELYSEKIKLVKEKENQDFLESDGKRKKATFFTKSRKLQIQAEKFGLNTIRAFSNYDKNSKIYYTLALNSRDYGKGKNVEKYLYRALKNAPAGTPIIYKAKVALAEYYYNEKKYKTAVNYYRSTLGKKHKTEREKDEWLSKHHYNLAWCYLKIVDYKKALDHLRTSYKYTKNDRYINIKDQIFNSAPIFYLYAGQVREGVQFIINGTKRSADYLSKLAQLTADRGSLKDAEYILERAYREAQNDSDSEEMIKVTLKKLEIFRNFKQNTKHYREAKQLAKLHDEFVIPKEYREMAINQLKGQVGYLQVRLKANPEKTSKYLVPIITYFNILKNVDKDKTDEYYYFQGETLYQSGKKKTALKAYIRGMRFAKGKKGRRKIKTKLVDAIFFTLEDTKLNKKTQTNTYRETYEFFLTEWPKEKRSEAIYDKLFNIYIQQGKDQLAHKLLLTYMKHYKQKMDKQRGFAAILIDYYVKTKNADKLSNWIIRIDKGYLAFKRDYIEKGLILLGNILFEELDNQAKDGDVDQAIKGYIALYQNKKYPRKIHSQAALNIAAMELERANTENSSIWTKNHIKKSTLKEVKQNSKNLFGITENILLLQDFEEAHKLSAFLLTSLCNTDLKIKSTLYRYAATLPVFEEQEKIALDNLRNYRKCKISPTVIKESLSYLIQYSMQNRKYDFLVDLYQKEGRNYLIQEEMAMAFVDFYWDASLNEKQKVQTFTKNIIQKYNARIKSNRLTQKISEIIHFENFRKMSEKLAWNFGNPKKFNESEFTAKLGSNLKKLEFLDGDAQKLLNYKHPVITLAVFESLYHSYVKFSESLIKIQPKGQPKEFQQTFNQQVSAINMSILEKSNEYKKYSAITSMKQGIFNSFGARLTKIHELEEMFHFRYPASQFLTPSNKIELPGGIQ